MKLLESVSIICSVNCFLSPDGSSSKSVSLHCLWLKSHPRIVKDLSWLLPIRCTVLYYSVSFKITHCFRTEMTPDNLPSLHNEHVGHIDLSSLPPLTTHTPFPSQEMPVSRPSDRSWMKRGKSVNSVPAKNVGRSLELAKCWGR